MNRRHGGGPDPVDVYVGGRMRQRRVLLNLSQQNLGASLGISFQQIQKYEKGSNRISASRLYELAQILDVPISFFFEDLPAYSGTVPLTGEHHVRLTDCSCLECRRGTCSDPTLDHDVLKLVAAYYRIRPPGLRNKLRALVRSLGEDTPGEDETDA